MLRNGTPAPDFELSNVDGSSFLLSEHTGRILVLCWIRGEW
jgi:peroxiredoxin